MKNIKLYLPLIFIFFALLSCEKEEDIIIVSGFGSSPIASNRTDVILTPDKDEAAVLAFSWEKSALTLSNSAMQAPESIPLVVIEASNSASFDTIIVITPSSNPHIITGLALNTLAGNLQLEAGRSTPVYFRTNSLLGRNMEPVFSDPVVVNVTPYRLNMTKGLILNSSLNETGAFLYSATSNGVYSGFMNANSWLNWFLREGDGTVWGNVGESGREFHISSDPASRWNMWFPGLGGFYYTNVDTNTRTWSATHLPSLALSGDVTGEMTFVRDSVLWLIPFTTTTANARFRINGNGLLFNTTSSTNQAAAIAAQLSIIPGLDNNFGYSFTQTSGDFVIPVPGQYTLRLYFADPTDLNYTITAGGTAIEEPASPLLFLPGIDDGITGGWNFNNTIRLVSEADKTYAGVVNVNSLWGYVMSPVVNEWNAVYRMGATAGTLRFGEGSNIAAPAPGLYLINANLRALTYRHLAIESVAFAGFNNNWTMTPMVPTSVVGVYTAPVTISGPSTHGARIYLNNNWQEFFGGNLGRLTYTSGNIVDDATIATGNYEMVVNLRDQTYVLLGNQVFITGLNDVWNFTSVVLARTAPGVYSGTAVISTRSPWGIRIHVDTSWNRYFGGSFSSLVYRGDNITDDQALAPGTYTVTVDFINNSCTFVLQ